MVNGVFQGPVRPGTDVEVFRSTGISVPTTSTSRVGGGGRAFAGPVRPGRDEEIFRKTGQSVVSGSTEATRIRSEIKKQEQQQIIEIAEAETQRQETIQARTISGQIQAFDPLATALPLPSRQELGGGKGFFGDLGIEVSSRFRRFFNVETAEDLGRRVRGERGIPISGGLGGVLVAQIPTGTIIDPASGIRQDITFGERVEQEAILGGGAGTPIEFLAQDIGREISSKGQRSLDVRASNIQRRINVGDLTLAQGEAELGKIEKQIEKDLQKEFETALKKDERISAKGRSGASLRKLRKSQQLDVISPVITGGIIGGLLVGGTPSIIAGAGLQVLGAQQFITGSGKGFGQVGLKPSQRALEFGKAGLGLVQVGIGGRALFGGLETQIDLLTIKEIQAQQELVLGRELARTPKGSLFRIQTIKQTGLGKITTTQRVPIFKGGGKEIFGTTESGARVLLKTDPQFFSITGGKGVARLDFFSVKTGDIVSRKLDFNLFGRGFPSPTQPIFRTKDLSLNLKDFQASFGRGGLIVDKQITTFPFGAIGREKEGILQIFSGDITKVRIQGAGTTRALFKPSSFGFIRKGNLLGGDGGVKLFIGGGAKTKGLSQVLRQELQLGIGLTSQTAKQTSSILSKTSISSNNLIGNLGAGASTILKVEDTTRQLGLPKTIGQVSIVKPGLREQVGLGSDMGVLIKPQRTRQESSLIIASNLPEQLGQGLIQSLGLGLAQRQPQKLRQKLVQKQISEIGFFPSSPSLKFDFGDVTNSRRGFLFPPFLPLFGERPGRKRRTRGRRVITRIAPSLTGGFLKAFSGITGGLPKELSIGGLSPLDIRLAPLDFQPRKRTKTKKRVKKITKRKIKKAVRRKKK